MFAMYRLMTIFAAFALRLRRPRLKTAVVLALLALLPLHEANAASRLKDIVSFEGVRDNMLVGYGLVVGLNGTGDSLTNAPFTARSLIGMLERLGINSSADFSTIKTKNIAAVMVTATLPPFSAQGSRVDVVVSTMGDAKSLQGGTLLVTPLQGADGEVYAVAQGSVASGFTRNTIPYRRIETILQISKVPNASCYRPATRATTVARHKGCVERCRLRSRPAREDHCAADS